MSYSTADPTKLVHGSRVDTHLKTHRRYSHLECLIRPWECGLPRRESQQWGADAPVDADDSSSAPAATTDPVHLWDRRVEYALGAANLVQQKLWPTLSFGDVCIVVFDQLKQRMYGCAKPYHEGDGPVELASVEDGLTGAEAFEAQPWFVIQTPEALEEEHPAFDAPVSTDEWLAIFIHEYFHIAQFAKASRFMSGAIKAGTFRDKALLEALYNDNAAYKSKVRTEYDALKAANLGSLQAPGAAQCSSLVVQRDLHRLKSHNL